MGIGADEKATKEIEEKWGVRLIQSYGSTDANIISGYLPGVKARPESAGRVFDEWCLKIFDQDDNELPPNKMGEIVIRHKEPFTLNLGYWKKPEATLELWRNLWFHTGDAGYFDEDGYLWFSTKIKDAIRRRGENISAYEVEMVINSHPAVLESAAIAVPSELGEDDLKVVVILKEGQKLSHEDLLKYCEDHLAYFAVPRYVEFKDALPKTEMGDKTKKYLLKEEGITLNTWDREKAGYKLRR
jgi:crotonobetaine/carnitine-CoA ligase